MHQCKVGWVVAGTLVVLASAGACHRKHPDATPNRASALSSSALAANAAPSSQASEPSSPFNGALARWNNATNAGDRQGLEAVYAKNLSLYERLVTRAEAVQRKLDYLAKHPKFTQTIAAVTWDELGEHRSARFRKTSSSAVDGASTVDAYLVFKQVDGAWLIVDEGDAQTQRKISAGLDTIRNNWKARVWDCPDCGSDPDRPDDPPVAYPPLGPGTVAAVGSGPPGAPATIAYARAFFPRFASAVDVPLFLKATAQSINGDGRWFYYDEPRTSADPPADSGQPKHLLECAIGGSFAFEPPPADAKPDPGHVGDPKVSYSSRLELRDHELYYERYIYAADGVNNYVLCTFDPAYRAFFSSIVQRMGRSMRAISGGQPGRVDRESQPYTAE